MGTLVRRGARRQWRHLFRDELLASDGGLQSLQSQGQLGRARGSGAQASRDRKILLVLGTFAEGRRSGLRRRGRSRQDQGEGAAAILEGGRRQFGRRTQALRLRSKAGSVADAARVRGAGKL